MIDGVSPKAEGEKAWLYGERLSSCPYDMGTVEWRVWCKSWMLLEGRMQATKRHYKATTQLALNAPSLERVREDEIEFINSVNQYARIRDEEAYLFRWAPEVACRIVPDAYSRDTYRRAVHCVPIVP